MEMENWTVQRLDMSFMTDKIRPLFNSLILLTLRVDTTGMDHLVGSLIRVVQQPVQKRLTLQVNTILWGQPGSTLNTLAPDSVYAMLLTTYTAAGALATIDELPVFIKTTSPKISADDRSVTGSNLHFIGSINDSYTTYGPYFEDEFKTDFDINDYLHVTADLTDSKNALVFSQPVTLHSDGQFELDLSGLTKGTNSLKITVDDAAGNHAEKVTTITSVDPVLTGVTVVPHSLTLGKGEQGQLNVSAQYQDINGKDLEPVNVSDKAIYSDYDASVITVDSNGQVTAAAAGTTSVLVSYENFNDTVNVNVTGNGTEIPGDPGPDPNPNEPGDPNHVLIIQVTLMCQSNLY